MNNPKRILDRLQDQMQRVWERFESAGDNGEHAMAAIHEQKYRDLETFEQQLLAEIRIGKKVAL